MNRENQINFSPASNQERANLKTSESSAAQGLLEGQAADRQAAERAEQEKKRGTDIEKMAQEIALLEGEITSMQGIVDNEERNAKEQARAAQGGEAAAIYEQSIALRNGEIAQLRATLSPEVASLDVERLRQLIGEKQQALTDAKDFRDGLLNS
jgi:hypothetical protein